MLKPVDTHCHINLSDYKNDLNFILAKMNEELEFAVNVGYNLKTTEESIELAEKNSFIYATCGIHPHDAADYNSEVEAALEEFVKHPKVVAVGEIGLDYYRNLSPADVQKDAFKKQIELALRNKKNIVVHCRDAYKDTIDILNEYKEIKGVMHSYSGSYETAKLLMDRFYFSISGPVTFKNSDKLKETVKKIPLERMMIETDSPYLTPEPFRGRRNEPVHVIYIANEIARIKGVGVEEVIRITTENAKNCFSIGE